MAYDKIVAHEFIIDESNNDDMLFIENCKKYDKILAEHIDNMELDGEPQPLFNDKIASIDTIIK